MSWLWATEMEKVPLTLRFCDRGPLAPCLTSTARHLALIPCPFVSPLLDFGFEVRAREPHVKRSAAAHFAPQAPTAPHFFFIRPSLHLSFPPSDRTLGTCRSMRMSRENKGKRPLARLTLGPACTPHVAMDCSGLTHLTCDLLGLRESSSR